MKVSLFLLSFFIFFESQLKAQDRTISLHIDGGANKEAMLAYYLGNKQYIFGEDGKNDIVTLDANGEGQFTRDDFQPGVFLLVFPPENNYIEFIYEGEDLDVYASTEGVIYHPKNTLANRLQAQLIGFNKRGAELEKSGTSRDSKEFADLNTEFQAFLAESRASHPNNMLVQIFNAGQDISIPENLTGDDRYYYFYEHYFDNIDFSLPWLMRSPNVYSRLNNYIDKYTIKHPDSLAAAVIRLAERTKPNEETFKFTVVDQLNKFANSKTMGHDKVYYKIVMEYYATGQAPWVESTQLKKILDNANRMKGTFLGDTATNFNMKTTEGEDITLHNVRSDYTVLFFTTPDCGHCKDASKKLREMENSMPTNTQVLSVLFNTLPDDGPKYKADNNYWWPVLVPTFSQSGGIMNAYNIRSYPILYILDSEKKIIAKHVGMDQVKTVIENHKKRAN